MPKSSIFENGLDLTDKGFYDIFSSDAARIAGLIWCNIVERDKRKEENKRRENARAKMSVFERAIEDSKEFTKYNMKIR